LPLYITNTSYFQNIDNLIIIQPYCDINNLFNNFKIQINDLPNDNEKKPAKTNVWASIKNMAPNNQQLMILSVAYKDI